MELHSHNRTAGVRQIGPIGDIMKKKMLIIFLCLIAPALLLAPSFSRQILRDAYSSLWNGDNRFGASRNAIYDRLETLLPGGVADVPHGGTGASTLTDGGVLSVAPLSATGSVVPSPTII